MRVDFSLSHWLFLDNRCVAETFKVNIIDVSLQRYNGRSSVLNKDLIECFYCSTDSVSD